MNVLNHELPQLMAEVDVVLDLYREPSSVESGSKWKMLSAMFRRLNDFDQIVTLRQHLADTMAECEVPSEELEERVNFYFDLAQIQDCLLESKRDVCKVCGCMEGLHRLGTYCPDQQLMARGMGSQASLTFTR